MSSRWTNKLISKAAKLSRRDSDDPQPTSAASDGSVNDFLYGAGGPPPPRNDAPRVHIQPPPALDLEDNDNGLGEPLPAPNPAYALPPLRRGKGIHVGFSDERPAVIGEGGDEAELPTTQVSKHAGLLSPVRSQAHEPPSIKVADTSELHMGTGNAIIPPADVSAGARNAFVARSATKKPGIGPGWLQKRKSFNMEEGQIQKQASSTDLAAVMPRQGFGASLDPRAPLQQRPIDPAPPPPSAAMDRLRERHASPMQNILRAAAGNIAHSDDPPKSEASKRWDQLLAHPAVKSKSPSPRSSPGPSSPEPHASPPSGLPSALADTPADAYAGGFRRGASPSRPTPTQLPQQDPPPAQHQPMPPPQGPESPSDSNQYSPYSPISNTVDRLMGQTQDISLADRWKPPEAYKPTGYAPARPARPEELSEHRNGPQPISSAPTAQTELQPSSRENAAELYGNHPLPGPTYGRRPADVSWKHQEAADINGRGASVSDPRGQPTLPTLPPQQVLPQQMQPPPTNERRPSYEERRQITQGPASGLAELPQRLPAAQIPGPPPGPPPARRPGAAMEPPPVSTSGPSSAPSLARQEPTLPILPPGPISNTPNHIPQDRHDPAAGSVGSQPKTLGVPLQAQRSRGSSVDAQASSNGPSSRGGSSPTPSYDPRFTNGLAPESVPPNAPSPVQVYSPGRGPRPERSPERPGSSSQPVYEPTRASMTGNFDACIDSLQTCLQQAEHEARGVIRNQMAQWLRLGSWWNLKGRKAFEARIKEQHDNVAARANEGFDDNLKQPFIDVAKAWWIVERVVPQLQRDPRSDFTQPSEGLDGQALQQVYYALKIQVETFISSVSRRRLLPSPAILNVNFTSFIVSYPQLPSVVRTLTAGLSPGVNHERPADGPFFGIVLADNARHFSYGHLFADTEITLSHGEDEEDENMVLSSVISLIRDKSMSQMEMVISSQDGQIDLRIRPDGRGMPTWKDVDLRPRSHSVRIQLMAEFSIVVRLEKEDFKTLWGIREYNKRVMDEWSPARDERLIYETRLYDFNYIPPKGGRQPLPSNTIRDCAMRLYEKVDAKGQRDTGNVLYRGHRMVVITSPDMKTLSNVSIPFEPNFPILHSLLRGDNGVPALLLHVSQDEQSFRVIPAFKDPEDRNRFCEKLSGSYLASDEVNIGSMHITNISVSTAVPGTPGNLLEIPNVQWTDIHILSKMEGGQDPRHSDRFRITADSNVGRLVDRPAAAKPGDLKIGLDPMDLNSIKLRRSADSSLVIALMENKLPNGLIQPLQDAFRKKATAASTIRYQFPSMPDMHEFEEIITGYRVLYDGLTSYFSIKGQLKAAGMHKKLEATRTRIQIVQDDKKNTLQLLAFFKDMPEGACMSFALSGSDTYEASHVSNRYFVRFVDARFGLPRSLSEPDATFVCLDVPEFAGERDDVMVGFDKEEDRERLIQALPAAPSKASGLASFKRFVELGKSSRENRPGSRQSHQSHAS